MDIRTVTASVVGGVGSAVILHPLDTILTLRQTSLSNSYVLPFRHYWRGLTASIVFSTPAFATYLVTYRQMKKELAPYFESDSAGTYLGAGITAEVVSNVFFTPMDNIKGRMQIKGGNQRVSTIGIMKGIYRANGITGFFRGYGVNFAIYTPSSLCFWYCYENLKTFLHKRKAKGQNLSASDYAFASSAATVLSESTSNFLDVVRTRQQLAVSEEIRRLRPNDERGLWQISKNLVKEAGLFRALVKGLHIRLLYSLPSGALAMTIVELVNPDISESLSEIL
ncbi:mitochondrial carrier domain-containing protein [Lipomyces japonicus]|uniref:mitochondrial carrier domain-containing protein n=1 Tax=Lipomyces japonicus TaxID=56871 RepID=UPI0034CD5EF8